MEHAPVADRIETSPTGAPATPAGGGCPFPHGAEVTAIPAESIRDDVVELDAARCPVAHGSAAEAPATGGCPVLHGPGGVRRSKADLVVRKLLRIQERPPGVSTASAYRTFQKSMMISATRCTLTYVVFPFVLPAVGFAKGVGPWIGIVIGTLALVCDTFAIRRFFIVDHKWRWQFSAIAFSIMCLLSVLLIQDVSHVVGNLVG